MEDKLTFNLTPSDLIHIPSDKKTTIGIRAEHIYPACEQEATNYLEVVGVEQLGNETIIVFEELGGHLWNAKWPGQWAINPGDKVPVQHLSSKFLFL